MFIFSRWKVTLILASFMLGLLFTIPNFLHGSFQQYLPQFVQDSRIVLGLDLQGGSHLLVEVESEGVIKARMQDLRGEARRILFKENKIKAKRKIEDDTLIVTPNDTAELDKAFEVLQDLDVPLSYGLLPGQEGKKEVILTKSDNGTILISLTAEGIEERLSAIVAQSIEVIRRRIDELGTTEPTIQRQGKDRILVQVPGFNDPEKLKDIISRTARLTFHLVDQSMSVSRAEAGEQPVDTIILPELGNPSQKYLLEEDASIGGETLTDANMAIGETGSAEVNINFDVKGAKLFGRLTRENVGRPFAIVLDEQVISAPVIQSAIPSGAARITGNFTPEEASDLSILLRGGALPADLVFIEERSVGPSLGADSVAAGQVAGLVGLLLVIVFMVLVYGFFGVLANIALLINLLLIFGTLSLLGATLTLPGIAGIVLTIGMAVDANVLIYERIREEARNGRKLIQALEAGFRQALATIIDANITTLIAAIILFWLGSGPIRGFAVTLAIGILTTLFTAYTVTRFLIALWLRWKQPNDLPIQPIQAQNTAKKKSGKKNEEAAKAPSSRKRGLLIGLIPDNTKIPFMWLRNYVFTATIGAVMASIALFMTVDLNYGIDFKGGTLLEVQSKAEVANIGELRTQLASLNLGDVEVQEFGSARDVLIRIEEQPGGEKAQQQVVNKVKETLQDQVEFRRTEVVGPRVSGELAQAGTIAVICSLFAVLIYIWFRFEWQFALGAIVALIHDVALTIGMFSLTQFEFNLASIAAILTIVGYSLNDTVVVYDRVRENLRRYKKMELPDLLDLSINQMLSRTILTSVTTALALMALYVLGGENLRGFTFAMIWGVVVGTYSSIFIAAPVLIFLKLRLDALDKPEAEANDEHDGAVV